MNSSVHSFRPVPAGCAGGGTRFAIEGIESADLDACS